MAKPIGGRGKAAPYETKLVRIPDTLEPQVNQLKDLYYKHLDEGGDPFNPVNWLMSEGESQAGGVNQAEVTLKRLESVIASWEVEASGKNLQTNVRWSQAAKLLTALRECLEGEE